MKKILDYIKSKDLLYLLPSMIWITLLTGINLFYSTNIINSDMSAELILARELANENKILTTDWYYSTEIRLVYTQLVSMFLFKIFSSWKLIRTVTNLAFYIFMLWSYLYCAKPLNLKKKAVYLSSALLFIPFSMEYIDIVHIGNSYMPHFVLMFLVVGLALRLFEQVKFKNLFLFLLLSLICGLCGIRYLTILAIPLFLSAVLNVILEYDKTEDNKASVKSIILDARFYVAISGFFCCFIGYLINNGVLSNFFQFRTYQELKYADMTYTNVYNNLIYRLSVLFTDTLSLFNYVNGISMKTFYGIGNLAAIASVFIFGIIVYKVTKKYNDYNQKIKITILFFLMSFFLHTFIFTFLEGMYTPRYYMFTIIFIFLLTAVFLSDEQFLKKLINKVLIIALIVAVSFLGVESIYISGITDSNKELKKASEFLLENDLSLGMATFWQAGVITELTDGKVNVVNVYGEYLPATYHWLLSKRYIRRETWENTETEQVFILLTPDEVQFNSDSEILKEGKLVYENSYYIFVYDKDDFMNKYGERIFLEE